MSDWTDLIYRSMYGEPNNPAGSKFGGADPFGLHDYLIPGMSQTWNWSKGARGGRWNDVDPGEATAVNGVTAHISGSTDYRFEVRNMEVWLRVNNAWARYYTTAGRDAAAIYGSYFTTSAYKHGGGMTETEGPGGGSSFAPRAFHFCHFYCQGGGPRVRIPSGFQRVHFRGQIRLVGPAASTAIAVGRIGADYFPSVGASAPAQDIQPSVAIPRMLRITDEWRWFTLTTLSPSEMSGPLAPPEPGAFVGVPVPGLPDVGEIPRDPAPDLQEGFEDAPDLPAYPTFESPSDSEIAAFNETETSTQCGAPLELYEFTAGNVFWRYTNVREDVEFEGDLYLSKPINRATSIAVSQESARNAITLEVPRELDLVQLYLVHPPTAVISLVVRRVHRDGGGFAVSWVGRILNVSWQGAKAELRCEPVSTSVKRTGLRRLYQTQCPHALYGTACRVRRRDFVSTATVTAISGDSVTVDQIADLPFAGGFVVRIGNDLDTLANIHYIRSVSGNVLTISKASATFQVDDLLEMVPGCDHTVTTCQDVFNNLVNFGGMPYFADKNLFAGDKVF